MRIADPETTFRLSLRFSDAPVIESPAVRKITVAVAPDGRELVVGGMASASSTVDGELLEELAAGLRLL